MKNPKNLVTLAQFFPQKSFVTCCTRLLFLCGYGAQDFTKKRPKKKKRKKKRVNFRSSKIILIACRLAKGVCKILLALSLFIKISSTWLQL
jgi:hypothetical protein